MNAIVQTKANRPNYYIVLDYKDNSGKRQRKWLSTGIPIKGNNKRKIEEKRKDILAEYEELDIDLSKNVLFTVFMNEWLENLRHSIAPTTYDGYKLILKAHIIPYFEPKNIKVKDLTPAHIQQYINYKLKKISSNTVIKHLRNMSKCLDNAVRQNLIAYNPIKRIDMPKKTKYTGAKFYNEAQIKKLLECSKDDILEVAILLTLFYGLRRSEVIGIKWDAIDFVNETITIKHTVTEMSNKIHKTDATKNDSSYAVLPMPFLIRQELVKWKARQMEHKLLQPNDYCNEGYVCTQIDGSIVKPTYATRHFKALLSKCELPIIRFHDLRHSSASYLKFLGFDLKDIQTWLRHGDIQTTMNIYTHIDMDAKVDIANNLNKKFINFSQ